MNLSGLLLSTPEAAPVEASVEEIHVRPRDDLAPIRRGIWVYFWLLLLEGVLRKWVLPSLSNPILIIRDPVAVFIYVMAIGRGVFPRNGFVIWIVGLAVASLIGSELGGRGNLIVSLYGLRTNFLHLPLIFVIAEVFTARDVERMGRWFCITAMPMALLVLAQFRASPDSWLNYGAGGGEGGQLESAFGRIRPPGTFSFTSGLVAYLALVAVNVLHPLMRKRKADFKLIIITLPFLVGMIAISGSRAALTSLFIVLLCVAVICVKKPVFFGSGVKILIALAITTVALSFWSEIRQGAEVHQSRLEGAGGIQEGLIMRMLSDLTDPFTALLDVPFFGYGLGMGTNAAAAFLYGKVTFLLAEGDWLRTVKESGPILGLCFIGLRLSILFHLGMRSYQQLERENPYPILLFSAAFPQVLNGQLGVPCLLGFAVLGAGLCLASTNEVETVTVSSVPLPLPDLLEPKIAANFRGRSIYAEQLHGEVENPDIERFGP